MAKNNQITSASELYLETRRDVMKLSLAVAAFGAAMGIAGPSSAASASRHRGPKGGGRDKIDTGRRRGPKEKIVVDTGRKEGPKVRSGSDAQ
jgi:hypothetical protein